MGSCVLCGGGVRAPPVCPAGRPAGVGSAEAFRLVAAGGVRRSTMRGSWRRPHAVVDKDVAR